MIISPKKAQGYESNWTKVYWGESRGLLERESLLTLLMLYLRPPLSRLWCFDWLKTTYVKMLSIKKDYFNSFYSIILLLCVENSSCHQHDWAHSFGSSQNFSRSIWLLASWYSKNSWEGSDKNDLKSAEKYLYNLYNCMLHKKVCPEVETPIEIWPFRFSKVFTF